MLRALPARETELAILRIGWRCDSEYAFAQHSIAGREPGFTDEEISRVVESPDAAGWSRFEAAILRGVDELHDHAFITDAT